ncbi:hypothetical protein D9M69_506790 [compost metagenome]
MVGARLYFSVKALMKAWLAALSDCGFQPLTTFTPSATLPVAASMRSSMENTGTTIGMLLDRPELPYCLAKLMPPPPGWNWNTASGFCARMRASSTEKSSWLSLV